MSDAVDPPVGCAEVGIGAEDGIIKKTGASVVGSDAPVGDQRLDQFPVYTAAGVVYELLDFKLIISHGGEAPFQIVPHRQDSQKKVHSRTEKHAVGRAISANFLLIASVLIPC